MLFICYPKCGTCQKAKKWLDEKGIPYGIRDIQQDRPTEQELREWRERSGLPLNRFFNTSGMEYRYLGLKDKLPQLSEGEQLQLLASSGMLVKRPLLVGETETLVGFRQEEWEAKLLPGKVRR